MLLRLYSGREKCYNIAMNIIKFYPGDMLHMKKPHPCGSNLFKVIRVGSDVRVICSGCGRDMTLPRLKLEKGIKKVISAAEADKSDDPITSRRFSIERHGYFVRKPADVLSLHGS